jgi:hypothetical protein
MMTADEVQSFIRGATVRAIDPETEQMVATVSYLPDGTCQMARRGATIGPGMPSSGTAPPTASIWSKSVLDSRRPTTPTGVARSFLSVRTAQTGLRRADSGYPRSGSTEGLPNDLVGAGRLPVPRMLRSFLVRIGER